MQSIERIKTENEKRAEHVTRRMQKADPDLYAALALLGRMDNAMTSLLDYVAPVNSRTYVQVRDEVRKEAAELTLLLQKKAKI